MLNLITQLSRNVYREKVRKGLSSCFRISRCSVLVEFPVPGSLGIVIDKVQNVFGLTKKEACLTVTIRPRHHYSSLWTPCTDQFKLSLSWKHRIFGRSVGD